MINAKFDALINVLKKNMEDLSMLVSPSLEILIKLLLQKEQWAMEYIMVESFLY